MPILEPIPLDVSRPRAGMSARSVAEHYKLYCGYVERFNELSGRLDVVKARGPGQAVSESGSLKVDMTFALGAIKNHELYFDILGEDEAPPGGALADALASDFGSVPQYLVDLKNTALASRGWAWTVYDLDYGHLFNYPGTAQNAMPVPNVVPIVAVDLYGHAYFYDFGSNKTAYVDAVLREIAWAKVAARWERARRMVGAER